MKIVLIGFACSYKSSAGKLLAKKLNYEHVDTDKLIEQFAGKTVADIFATDGENAFRGLERQALLSLTDCDNVVISCGGGTATCSDFKLLANNATVVWLTANAATVRSRLGDVARPLFDGKSEKEIANLIEIRTPYYNQYADITVATDNLNSMQVADVVLSKILQNL